MSVFDPANPDLSSIAEDSEEIRHKINPNPEERFLRAENKKLRRHVKGLEKQVGELQEWGRLFQESLDTLPPPRRVDYSLPKLKHHEVKAILNLADWHAEEVVDPAEMEGYGGFTWDMFLNRAWETGQKAVELTNIMRQSSRVDQLFVNLLGDMCCFPAGTAVTMADGTTKNIEEITRGDAVLTNPEPREVTRIFKRSASAGEKIFTIKTCKGMPLRGTGEHVVRRLPREKVETGWNPGGKRGVPFIIRDKTGLCDDDIDECPISELRPGDYLVVRPFRPTDGRATLNIAEITGLQLADDGTRLTRKVRGRSPCIVSSPEIEIDNDLLWLIGLYLAEGSPVIGRSGHFNGATFTLHQDEEALSQKVVRIIKQKFGYTPSDRRKPKRGVRVVQINNQIIATLLVALCGQGSSSKIIDSRLYSTPRSLLPLVAGWIDGDGGYNPRGQSITGVTINRDLARQMSTILWSERVSHGFYQDTSSRGRWYLPYRLMLTGENAELVGSYTVKHAQHPFRSTYQDGVWAGDSYCLRITSIRSAAAKSPLYDLQIEGNHYYQAEGFVVHNSGEIHEDLIRTNAFGTPEAVVRVANVLAQLITALSGHFEEIHLTGIAGNHGRLDHKPPAKQKAYRNWDTAVYWIAQLLTESLTNVYWTIPKSAAWIVKLGQRSALLKHGDQIRMRYRTPYYSMEDDQAKEKAKRENTLLLDIDEADLEELRGGTSFQYMFMGHWHHFGLLKDTIIVCPSLMGPNQYSYIQLHTASPPQQLLSFYTDHNNRGLINHWPIQLNLAGTNKFNDMET